MWPAIWKISDNLANKGIKEYIIINNNQLYFLSSDVITVSTEILANLRHYFKLGLQAAEAAHRILGSRRK